MEGQEIIDQINDAPLLQFETSDDLEENKVDAQGNVVRGSDGSSKRNKMILKEQIKLLSNQDKHLDDLGKYNKYIFTC